MTRYRLRQRLHKLRLLLFSPAQWSAEHYREKNSYDTVATTPEKWSEPRQPPESEQSP